jgi:diguanylate cyclase (GGDEF)-like protein
MRIRNKAPSLRTRYFLTTAVVSLLLVGVGISSYSRTLEINKRNNNDLSLTDQHLSGVALIRHETAALYQLLDQFLLDPTRRDVRQQLENDGFQLLKEHITGLKATSVALGLDSHFEDLNATLSQLRDYVSQIVRTRLDTNIQYPAMALSADRMADSQRGVRSDLEILLDEIERGGFQPRSPQLYASILKAQVTWANCIAQMRIYLANRLASFSSEILISQAQSLKDYFMEFREQLDQLQMIYQSEKDSFEGQEIMRQIKMKAETWFNTFQEVRAINESDRWREDNHLMETLIIPTMDNLYQKLDGIDETLKRNRQLVAASLTANSREKDLILAAFIVVFIGFVSVLLASMEFMIFRPIIKVTRALKSRAFGIDNPQFYRLLSAETQQLVEAFEEMNAEVSHREKALEYQALHDPLTALPNRAMLNDRLEYLLSMMNRENGHFCLFLIDLNEFKEVNDSLGHQVGDALLIEVANTLRGRIRSTDTIARLGGDEFAVLLPNADARQGERVAKHISESFKQQFRAQGYSIKTDASLGIAVYPRDGENADMLLQRADVAMYNAKRGHQNYAFYDSAYDTNSPARIALVNDLRAAIENNQLELYFQPQKDLCSGAIYGAEALLRWQHPQFGYINPERIVEIAERIGIIGRLTHWVLEQALGQCVKCHQAQCPITVSINISVHNLNHDGFAQQVKTALDDAGLEARWLNLEVTENAVMLNPGRAVAMLDKLTQFGVGLSIDDYGTGFASLSYLKKMPVQVLKIDKSFVMHMDQNRNDEIIVKSTIDMGHNLGLSVVAEGIESATVAAMLQCMQCDSLQGYWLSRPLDAGNFMQWLQGHDRFTRGNRQRWTRAAS